MSSRVFRCHLGFVKAEKDGMRQRKGTKRGVDRAAVDCLFVFSPDFLCCQIHYGG